MVLRRGQKPKKNNKLRRTKNNGGRRGRGGPASRSTADRVLAQGVGAVTKHAFGNGGYPGGRSSQKNCNDLRCWDATMPHHLALPRAVGPYLTVRLTRYFGTPAPIVMFGTFWAENPGGPGTYGTGAWANMIAQYPNDITKPAGETNNVTRLCVDTSGIGTNCTWCPSALTVQVMNQGAIGDTKGIAYGGRLTTQVQWGGQVSKTWSNLATDFIQYQKPRLMSAGKLSLRGVKIDSFPMNMAKVSDFTKPDIIDNMTTGTWGANIQPAGWAPIIIINSIGSDPGDRPYLQYLVTSEWRVRFDLSEAASAAHIHHDVSTDQTWNNLMRRAVATGHGVIDIVESIADTGAMMGKAAARVASFL